MFAPRRRSEGLDPVGWKALDKLRGLSIRGPSAGEPAPEASSGTASATSPPIAFAPDWNALAAQATPVGDPPPAASPPPESPTAFLHVDPAPMSQPAALPALRESALMAVLAAPAPPPTYATRHVTVAKPARSRIRLGDIWSNSAPTEARLFALELAKVAVVMQNPRAAAASPPFFALSGLRGMAVALSLLIAGLFAGNAVVVSSADIQDAASSSAPDLSSLAGLVAVLPTAAIGPFGFGAGPDHRVEVCHRLGNGGAHTITIDDHAVAAHVAHGDHRGACGPADPGGNGTDPGGNETGPGGNGTDPGGNETGPGGNETGPGGNETGPSDGNGTDSETDPDANQTGPTTGGGSSGQPALGDILLSVGGGGAGPASAPAAAAAPAANAGTGGSGGSGAGNAPGHDILLRSSVPMPGSLSSSAPGTLLALGNVMEAASGRRSHREGAPHGEDEDQSGAAEGEDADDDADGAADAEADGHAGDA